MSRRCTRRELSIQLGLELREYLCAADMYDEAVAHKLGLSRTDVRCIDLLVRRGTMAAGELGDATGLSSGAVTFLVDRLELAGVVIRRRDPSDRRRVLVELVPEAARRSYEVHSPMVEDMRALLGRHTVGELETIRAFLRDARGVYARHAPNLRGKSVERAADDR
ncbi:MAG: MarR family winged helix-turn-helix transcriptional regulator [Acidimicrobiales bacterium]